MKNIFTLLLILYSFQGISQLKLSSWNIQDMGKSKSQEIILYIASQLRDFDVVAIQEVVAGYGGAQAVARLADELNRMGAKWEYEISDPTISSPYTSERYAYLWKTNKVKRIGKPWLDQNFINEIEREPFFIRFSYKSKEFTLVNFHALPTKKQPETEIKFFKNYPQLYPEEYFIFLGDFNVPDSHTVFNPLKKQGYLNAFTGKKTSLKMNCNTQIKQDCLSKSYDHFMFPSPYFKLLNGGIIYFYEDFKNVNQARKVSDHLPIWMEFDLN